MPPQQAYYYPAAFNGGNMQPSATAPSFVPQVQQNQPGSYTPQNTSEPQQGQGNGQLAPSNQGLIAQEVNGMVYYYDPNQISQIPAVPSFPTYSGPQGYVPGVVGMGGMVTPSPDTFFPYQANPGVVYYPQ
jgi:hypothetical protein